MTDFRSLDRLFVYKEDCHVGYLERLPKGCRFRYTDDYLRSQEPAIALHLPKTPEGVTTEGIANLPTYFAGLLPEGVMFQAVKTQIGSAADDLFAVLAATGRDTIGDVDVRVPGEETDASLLSLQEATIYLEALLKDKTSDLHVAAIPGVQPKMSLGYLVRSHRRTSFIAKFPPPQFPGLVNNEYAFMRLARKCRIRSADVKIKAKTLLVSRFDRHYDQHTKALRKVHVEDMLQVMDLFPNSKYSMEYRDLLKAIQGLATPKWTLVEALRLYVYSYIIGNGDLHAKNVSLIWNPQQRQWTLAPAYDLLSTLPYKNLEDRMALALADEAYGRFTAKDFTNIGTEFDLPEEFVNQEVVRTVAGLVLLFYPGIVGDAVPQEVSNTILQRADSLVS